MSKFSHSARFASVALLLAVAVDARAAIPATRLNGVQLSPSASNPVASGSSGLWWNGSAKGPMWVDSSGNSVMLGPGKMGAFNVKSYGAKGDNATDDTAAIEAAIAANAGRGEIYLPKGIYRITDTIDLTQDQVCLVGDGGQWATILKFDPASGPKAAIKLDNGGGSRMYGSCVRNIYLQAGNATVAKIGIDVVDCSGCTVEDVWVDPVTAAAPPWHTVFSSGAGTVAGTNGSATITGTGTNFLSGDIGKHIEIGGKRYLITAVASTTSITVSPAFYGSTASGLAYGTGYNSIGIRLRGREFTVVNRVRSWADEPFVVEVDPYIATPVSCDHLHVSNTYLLSRPGIGSATFRIADGVLVSNLTVDGYNSWIPDRYGILWEDSGGATTNTFNVRFENIRFEQFDDSTGWNVWIKRGKGLQNVQFVNVYFATNVNGVHLDGGLTSGTQGVSFIGGFFANSNGARHSFQTAGVNADLCFQNVVFTSGGTADMTGVSLLREEPRLNTGAPISQTACYSTSAQAARAATVGTPVDHSSFIRYTGATTALPTSVTYTAPTLLNSWVALSAAHSQPGYMKTPDGFVHLRGCVTGGSSSTAVIFALPAGYRPLKATIVPLVLSGAMGQAQISANGNVAATVGSTAQECFDGVNFLAEQ